jgi:hypothetical protein
LGITHVGILSGETDDDNACYWIFFVDNTLRASRTFCIGAKRFWGTDHRAMPAYVPGERSRSLFSLFFFYILSSLHLYPAAVQIARIESHEEPDTTFRAMQGVGSGQGGMYRQIPYEIVEWGGSSHPGAGMHRSDPNVPMT